MQGQKGEQGQHGGAGRGGTDSKVGRGAEQGEGLGARPSLPCWGLAPQLHPMLAVSGDQLVAPRAAQSHGPRSKGSSLSPLQTLRPRVQAQTPLGAAELPGMPYGCTTASQAGGALGPGEAWLEEGSGTTTVTQTPLVPPAECQSLLCRGAGAGQTGPQEHTEAETGRAQQGT